MAQKQPHTEPHLDPQGSSHHAGRPWGGGGSSAHVMETTSVHVPSRDLMVTPSKHLGQ